MLLIPLDGEGVDVKPIKTSYAPSAGTGYITFEDVLVPVENLLGKEGKGVFVILSKSVFVPLDLYLVMAADSLVVVASTTNVSSWPPLLADLLDCSFIPPAPCPFVD